MHAANGAVMFIDNQEEKMKKAWTMENEQINYNKILLQRHWYQNYTTLFLTVIAILYMATIPITILVPESKSLLLKGEMIFAVVMGCLHAAAVQWCVRDRDWREKMKSGLQIPMEEDKKFLRYLEKREEGISCLRSEEAIDRAALKAHRTLFLTGESFREGVEAANLQGGSIMLVGLVPAACLFSGLWVFSSNAIQASTLLFQCGGIAILYISLYLVSRKTFLNFSEKVAAEATVELPSTTPT